MAELKRNFLKGRMNKDLDERLVSNGEYRDALNIEVSTSEGSEVGTVQNIKGNLKVSNISFLDDSNSAVRLHNSSDANSAITVSGNPWADQILNTQNAVTIGSKSDHRTDKIYNFVHLANDLFTSNTIFDGTNGTGVAWLGLVRYEGIKYDAIREYTPSVTEAGGSYKTIFRDIYEVRWAPVFNGTKEPMWDANGADIFTRVTGLPTYTTGGATLSMGSGNNMQTQYHPIGIRKGMRVQCVSPTGHDIWAGCKVHVLDVLPTASDAGHGNGIIKIERPKIGGVYTPSLRSSGYVLKFTAPRVLKFESGILETESNTDANNATKTPTQRIITGINIADDLLFWTDGRTEPKKINIKRCKEGTPDSKFKHTTNKSHPDIFDVEEKHITVIRPNPKYPPLVQALGISREPDIIQTYNDAINPGTFVTNVYDGTTQPEHYYSPQTTSIVYEHAANSFNGLGALAFTNAGGTPSGPGDVFDIVAQTQKIHWKVDDIIRLSGLTSGAVVIAKITMSYAGSNFDFDRFRIELIENDSDTQQGQDGEVWYAELGSENRKNLYTEKFISFAYRYKYEDGEISCISPYSMPAFKPGFYNYSSKNGWNSGMTNMAESITVKNFIPTDIPKDVSEVQLLYKDHDFDSVHVFKTISKTKNPTLWNQQGDGKNQGFLTIKAEVFGKMLPDIQKDRLFDHLPKAARAQEFSAGRLMYGNYLKDYDLGTSIANVSSSTTFYYESRTAEIINLETGTESIAIANASEHGDRQCLDWDYVKKGCWSGFTGVGSVFTGATGQDFISNHFVENVTTGNVDAGLGQTNNILVNKLSNHQGSYGNAVNEEYSDGSIGGSFWPAGTFPSSIGTVNYNMVVGQNLTQTDVYNKLNMLNQLSDPDSWYVQQNNGAVAVGWDITVAGGSSAQSPFSARPGDYMDARWWGRFGFKINFSDVTQSANNYDNDPYVIIEDANNQLDPGVSADFPNDDSRETHPQTVSTYKLTQNGQYQIRAHCRFRCSRTFLNSSAQKEKWAYYMRHPARLAIYRTDSDGVPIGLPLATGDWESYNYQYPGQYYPRENFPFMSQGRNDMLSNDLDWAMGIDNTTFNGWNYNNMFNADSRKHYRGIEIEATIIVENNDDITQQNVCAKDTSICVVFEAKPFIDSTDPLKSIDCWVGMQGGVGQALNAEIADLNEEMIIYCSIDDESSDYDHAGYGDYLATTPDHFGNTGNAVFEIVSAPSEEGEAVAAMGSPSLKSNRSYDIGYVYGDKFGRESTIITSADNSSIVGSNAADAYSNFVVRNNSQNIPDWAEYYKFFIRENSGKYHNIVMHKAYDNNPDTGVSTDFVWMSFNSSEVNKVRKGDYLLLKKEHGSNISAIGDFLKTRVIEISNTLPEGRDGVEIDTSAASAIQGPDKAGKFFIKLRWDEDLKNSIIDHDNLSDEQVFELLQDQSNSNNGAVFEVLPKSVVEDEDISDELFGFFYEASQAYPLRLIGDVAEQYIPVGSRVTFTNLSPVQSDPNGVWVLFNNSSERVLAVKGATSSGIAETGGSSVNTSGEQGYCHVKITDNNGLVGLGYDIGTDGMLMRFTRPDGSFTEAKLRKQIGNDYYFDQWTANQTIGLSWYNCISFGNGVEADRINDDFNQTSLYPYTAIGKQSGFKGVLKQDDYKEEWRHHDIIFSQLYNEDRGINGSNQFILADNPRKKLSPAHGSIQKLFARDNDLIALCENKILRILSSGKDALFNADGNMQVLSTANVLGQAIPFVGDYGISRNPESFAADEF